MSESEKHRPGDFKGTGNLLASPPRARYHRRSMNTVTQILSALGQGDPHAARRLLQEEQL
jgi:hypothetical protein